MNSHSATRAATNEALGFLADARLLIINADDFGMCHSNNEATLQSFKAGLVSSTTLMAPCPWAPHAMQILKDNPEFPFGVHLTLISENDGYRWGPLASRDKVSSLVDSYGYFHKIANIPDLLERAILEHVEIEFRTQIEAVLAADLAPTHFDWHCLQDAGREDVFLLTLELGREYGLAVRTHTQDAARHCREVGHPAIDFPLLDSYSVGLSGKTDHLARLLRELPVGLSEWAVHPSLGNAESKAMEPDSWEVRKSDFDFLVSREAREVVQREGIILTDYRALQERIAH